MIVTPLTTALGNNSLTFARIIDTPTDIVITFNMVDDSLYRMHELTYPVTVTDFEDRTVAFPIADMQLVLDLLDF